MRTFHKGFLHMTSCHLAAPARSLSGLHIHLMGHNEKHKNKDRRLNNTMGVPCGYSLCVLPVGVWNSCSSFVQLHVFCVTPAHQQYVFLCKLPTVPTADSALYVRLSCWPGIS